MHGCMRYAIVIIPGKVRVGQVKNQYACSMQLSLSGASQISEGFLIQDSGPETGTTDWKTLSRLSQVLYEMGIKFIAKNSYYGFTYKKGVKFIAKSQNGC